VKVRSKAFIAFIILAAIYASVSLIAAPPRASLQHYHISSTTLRLLNTTVILPVIAIWFIGLFGYEMLRTYATYVQGDKEGKRIMELTRGIMVLAWWLPIVSTISALLGLLSRWYPHLLAGTVIISNYLSLLCPLTAFWLICRGSRRLSELSHQRPNQNSIHIMAFALILGSIIYGYLVATAREHLWTIYHMPVWIVLLTLVVPYVFTWYLGLIAAFDLHVYTGKVKGLIYRKGWTQVALGIAWIIVTIIILQYISAVSARVGNMSLGWVLLLVYAILGVMAVGYILIALGAKKLMRIEEA
jgi:hypothetical protein